MIKNTRNSYGLVSRILHWVMAFIIIVMIGVGFYMSSIENYNTMKAEIYSLHKATGVLVLVLLIIRIFWNMFNPKVQPVNTLSTIEKLLSKITHISLYIIVFIMSCSGFLMSIFAGRHINVYNLFTIKAFYQNPEIAKVCHSIHEITPPILISLIVLHIIAGLYHHFIAKDNVLVRMIKNS